MVKKSTCLLSAAMALLASFASPEAQAQVALRTTDSRMPESVTKDAPHTATGKASMLQNDFVRKHPLMAKVNNSSAFVTTPAHGTTWAGNPLLKTSLKLKGAAKAPMMAATTGRELWGCVASQSTWDSGTANYGVYSFNAASPITVSAKATNGNMVATGGGALVDGIYHMVYSVESWGMIFMTHYAFDTNTWIQTAADDIEDYALFARETAVASDGQVYGEFYTSSLDGYELGVVDYNTLTRTTIGTLNNSYVALGITSDNVLYGVASDGNLYKIDATTAEETLVGSTGLTVADSYGDYYGQSGEIDYRTNTFYWAAVDVNHASALYTIDLNTGAATKVGDFPAEEQIYALSIPEPATADGAPAAIDDLAIAFDGPSFSGTATFTAPSTTYGGASLTGTVNYYVVAGADTLARGTTTAGSKVEAAISVKNGGALSFKAITTNAEGESPKAICKKYVGYDTPMDIDAVTLSANERTGEMTVSWIPPVMGVNKGYVGDLTYDIVRYPDGVTVATGVKGIEYTETLNATEMKAYHYGVTAVNGTMRSNETTSNKVVAGPALVPPYANTFDGSDAFDLMTVIDSNNDGSTWSLYNYSDGTGYAQYKYNSKNTGDDWLITPSLRLEAGKEYIVSFDAASFQSKYPERLEVKYGVGGDPTTYTGVLLESTDIKSAAYTTYTKAIVPDADADVKIAFHCISDPYMYYLMLKNLSVGEGSSVAAPDSATAVTVTPDAHGAHEATVSFTLPTKAINGTTLTAITKADVLRGGQVVGSVSEGLTPGATASFTDTDVPNGKNKYSVRIYNANGGGRYSGETTAFVGIDKPCEVEAEGIKVKDNTSSVDLTWKPVTEGVNGGYVDTDNLCYNIYYKLGSASLALIDSVKGTTAYNMTAATNEGTQQMASFALTAKNAMGETKKVYAATTIFGKPYSLPFRETFAGGKRVNEMWWTTSPGASEWSMTSRKSADDQGGAAVFDGYDDDAYLASGKIDIHGAASPKLIFQTCADKKSQATISVLIRRYDGSVDTIYAIPYNTKDSTATTQWTKHTLSLENYSADPYIIVQFCGLGTTSGSIYLDDVNVRNLFAHDLAAEISAPASVKKGDQTTATVKVTNNGENSADAYNVKFYAGGQLVEVQSSSAPLAVGESATFNFDYTSSAVDEGSQVELKAVVEYAADMNAADNSATATMELLASTKAAPTSATATATATSAQVAWTAPATATEEVTEGFEGYDTWSIDRIGDWTCIDGDKGTTGKILADGYGYGHQGEQFAFEVWEPEAIYEGFVKANASFAPHSGGKYAAAMYSTSGGNYVDADNWLISPLLSGDKQTVKFYATNQGDAQYIYNETLEMLYTTGAAADTAKYEPLGAVVIEDMEWVEKSFEVPAGATHFALRHITSGGGFMLALDDITYTPGNGTIIGYNIYRNGEYLTNVSASATSFVDKSAKAGATYTYAVTALYADGESAPAAAAPVTVTAIATATADAPTYTVYTVDGRHIATGLKTLKGLKKGVYIVNDKKMVVK